jgi:hypothetical protein
MRKYISYFLSAWLIVAFTSLIPEQVFSQTTQQGIRTEAADSLTTMRVEDSTYVKGITGGRAISLVGTVMGLISLIFGWRAKVRSSLSAAKTGLAFGLISIVLGLVHLSTVAGAAFGSGSGKAGTIVALSLAMIGTILAGLTLRSRNTN